MRPRPIEVGAVVLQDHAQLTYAEHEYMIQTLLPQTPYPAFTNRIRPRHVERRVGYFNAGGLDHPLKHWTILTVIVTDQVRRLLTKGRRFAQLMRDLCVGWMFRHADVQHAPTVVMHDRKGMQRLDQQRHHGHEIIRPAVPPVRLQKRRPGWPWSWYRARRLHIFLNGPLRHLDLQLQQLAAPLFRAESVPPPIRDREASRAIRSINAIVSGVRRCGCTCLGARDFHFQNNRNPSRCQRSSVSGWTICRTCFQLGTQCARNNNDHRSC